MSEYAIDIKGLNKTYGGAKGKNGKTALKDVDLQIPRGSIFALLGPNGAGKSTLINIMAGLVIKSGGQVKIWDTDIDDDARQARASIGVVPQEINFDPFFTPRQLLDLQAGMYGVPKDERRTEELLELVGLEDKADAYARSLSGGMRRRLMVAKAMVHNPPILVLDEPTAGVDIELRQKLWESVQGLNRQGTTVLLTTHYLEEAEQLCDYIAIIHQSEIIVCEEKEVLLSRIDQKEVTFRLKDPVQDIPVSLSEFNPEQVGKRSIKCRYSPQDDAVNKMIVAIHEAGFTIADISTERSDLEDVFLQLTRQDNAAAA